MTVVVVSWLLILLALFGVNYSHEALGESRTARQEVARHQLRAWAYSGVELARAALEATHPIERAVYVRAGTDHPLARVRTCGTGRFAVGAVDEHGLRRAGLSDEGARLPTALVDSLTLTLLPGMTPEGAAALRRALRTAGEHRPPPFDLMGLDASSLACCRRYMTRYGRSVNVNTAPTAVLAALGLPEAAASKLVRWRAGPDRLHDTADDRRFPGLDGDARAVRACGLNSEEAAVLAVLTGSGRLTVDSAFYRVASRGWGEGLDGICEIVAILEQPDDAPARIVEWTEHWLE